VTSKGRKLYKAIIKFSNNLDYVSPGSPTYWPADPRKVPDVIDFVVTKIISRNLVRAKSLLHLSSDHSPVLIILLQSPKIIRHPYRLTSHRTNWLKYKKYVPTLIEPYSSTPIMTSITVPMPWTPHSRQQPIPQETTMRSNQYQINLQIEQIVREKRFPRRAWQSGRSPHSKKLFNEATHRLTKTLKQEEELAQRWYVEKLSPTSTISYLVESSYKFKLSDRKSHSD